MSEREFSDLAPGDPISQDGSLREFRYSQFSDCPSAPFNTAEPECLPSQFHISASLTTSPLLEFEGHEYMLNDGRRREPSSSLPCSQRRADAFVEGVECNPTCGEHLHSGSTISDSLELSLFDAVYLGSKESERCIRNPEEETHASDAGGSVSAQQDSPLRTPVRHSPRRIYCDPRLLEEETQAFDVGVSDSKQQDSHLLFTTPHLQLAPQTTAAERETGLPILAIKRGCHAAVEESADICHRWHNRRRIAPAATSVLSPSACMSLAAEAKSEIIQPSTRCALDAGHFQRQPSDLEPVNPSPSATIQTTSVTNEDDFDTVHRCHSKRRISLAALSNLDLSPNIRLPMETKQEITKPSTPDALDADHCRGQPTVVDPENVSPTSTNQKILTAVEDDSDILQRWHNRKRVALSAITNLSSSSDKKLKKTTDKSVELGATPHSTELQDQLVKNLLLNDNENGSVTECGYVTPCMDAISSRSGSETIEEDTNVNDDTDDSTLLRRNLTYSCARDIKSFLQPVTAPNRHTSNLSSTNENGVSKQEQADEKWTYPKKNRPGGRQRTMDAWIK